MEVKKWGRDRLEDKALPYGILSTIKHLRRPSNIVQKLRGKVGSVGPFDGVTRQAVLDELVEVKQFTKHFAR